MAFPDQDRDDLRRRFDEFHRTRDPVLRDELVAAHLRLAVHLARRFSNRGVPLDDLIQVASLGLLHAVDRFDPTRGLEFSTFATPTIVGELKRHFRDKGWSVRVPRRVQELHVRLNSVISELTHRLGRSPTIAELALATRSSPEEVLEAMEASQAYRALSIDTPTGPAGERGDSEADRLGGTDDTLAQVDDRAVIERILATLPPREQLMVRLRYYEEMTQSEIAERLGISQMHVSRLLARCLVRFREVLEADELTDGERGAGATR